MMDEIFGSIILVGLVFLISYPFWKIKLKRMEKKFEKEITPELYKELKDKQEETEKNIDTEYKEVEDGRIREKERRASEREERIKRRDERIEREAREVRGREQANDSDNQGGSSETEDIEQPKQEGVSIPETTEDGRDDSFVNSNSPILSEQNQTNTTSETTIETEEGDENDFMD